MDGFNFRIGTRKIMYCMGMVKRKRGGGDKRKRNKEVFLKRALPVFKIYLK